jgi:RNA polymerase sigma-70 factor (ECF subfamily)
VLGAGGVVGLWSMQTEEMRGSNPSAARECRDERLAQCLVLVAHGDREAFAALYTALFTQVLAVIQRVVRDHAQSEEVAQEVMVEVWASAGRYRPGRGSVGGWVTTIARRRAVDRARHYEARVRRERREADLARSPAHDSVAECVERVLEQEGVRRSLGVLTPLQAEAIRLAFYEGRSYREVAERLGVPLGTAKTRIRDGLARLRQDLDQDQDQDR